VTTPMDAVSALMPVIFFGHGNPMNAITASTYSGDPALALRVHQLLVGMNVGRDETWGLDHGTWSVLRHVYPASAAHAEETCSVFTKARQSATTPELALARLRAGNARFVAGRTENCDLRLQVHGTAKGQAPFATVLGCMDSRVRPEVVLTNASANSNPRPPDYKEVSSARLCADISFNSRGSFLLMNCSMCPTGTGSIASAT
jgi:hypothetical protein